MYACGIITRDIQGHPQEINGVEVLLLPELISSVKTDTAHSDEGSYLKHQITAFALHFFDDLIVFFDFLAENEYNIQKHSYA